MSKFAHLLVSVVTLLVLVAGTAAAGERCGRPVSDGDHPMAADALFVLRAALASEHCRLDVCDVDHDCDISAVDALATLRAAVGASGPLDCVSECPTEIPCEDADAPVCNGVCPSGQVCAPTGEEAPGRTTICHIPPGNPANAHTIVVGTPAVQAHLRHGDYLGPCERDVPDCKDPNGCPELQKKPEPGGCDARKHPDGCTAPGDDPEGPGDGGDEQQVCVCVEAPSTTTTSTLVPPSTTTTTLTTPSTTTTTTTTLPEPTTTLPEPTTTLPEPTTTLPEPTTTLPEPTTTLPEPTTTTTLGS